MAQHDRFVPSRLPAPEAQPSFRYTTPELAALAARENLNLVHELLDRAVRDKGFAERPLLRSAKRCLSYRQVQAELDRAARVLVYTLGLQSGQRVLLRGSNSIGLCILWLAVVKAGLIAVATMPLLRAKELSEIIDKAQPVLALCEDALLAELQMAQTAHPVLARTLTFRAAWPGDDVANWLAELAPVHTGAEPIDARSSEVFALDRCSVDALSVDAVSRSVPSFDAYPCLASDAALIAFTSGTTGQPKAVVHTHRDVLAACEAWPRHVLRAQPHDIVIGSPPLAFTFGLGGLLIFPMWAGASVYFPDGPYTPERMARLLGDLGATICYTAPTFYRQMAAFMTPSKPCAARASALRLCVSAGEALPQATRQLWQDATGLDLIDGIGATEMFHIFISSAGPGASAQRPPGSIGHVVPGYSARVVDAAGQEVPRGSVGRLAVVGPTGCRYLDDARQAQYVQGGWNYPGDAFSQDEGGYFFYQSRADDMIITAGYNVGGPEVEDCLLQHPGVAECGVVGLPDAERGMRIKAFVVLRAGVLENADTVRALQEHVKAHIAPYKYPREIEFLPQLPRTDTGKLQRFKLKTR